MNHHLHRVFSPGNLRKRLCWSGLLGFLLVFGICFPRPVPGQVATGSLPWKNNLAYNSYLMRMVHAQFAERTLRLGQAVTSREGIRSYVEQLRSDYKKLLGTMPSGEELKAKVVRRVSMPGYTLEALYFQSLPGRYVTANLYLPEGKGPFPASLELCGHSLSGKAGSQEAILMALHGIAVLVVDPIGQGERIQLLDQAGNPVTRGATTEHTLLNAGCNLVGSSVAAAELFDNIRAIDYLETRSDVDKDRLGAYGSSGGGTQTAYLLGVETRLKVASICSYFSQRERVLELSGASDGCQHIPGEGRTGMEIADMVAMFSPKPVLIMAGLYDFVDYQGVLNGFSDLKKIYGGWGCPENIQLFTAESGHGMPLSKREALATFFRKWLCNDATPVHEAKLPPVDPPLFLCTTTGQVQTAFPDARSLMADNLRLAEGWAGDRKAFFGQPAGKVGADIKALIGVPADSQPVTAEITGRSRERSFDKIRFQLLRKGEMPLPVVLILPEKRSSSCRILIHLADQGKEAFLSDENAILQVVNQGDLLVAADLRGMGETADPAMYNDLKYWNAEYRNAMISLHMGRSLLGQRVTDLLTLLDFLSSNPETKGCRILAEASGACGPVLIHATVLDKRIAQSTITASLVSYLEALRNPLQRDLCSQVIPGVLRRYDLPDLVRYAGGRILRPDVKN